MTQLSADRCEVECLHPQAVKPLLGRLLTTSEATAVGTWFEVLADPTRTRILQALHLAPEQCVCDLALVLGLSVSALSHQLRFLRERGVVARRKAGRIAFYSLVDGDVRRVLDDVLTQVGPRARIAS